ncbi:MAG: hypothetical protein ACK58L_01555 [Planctomycetota bacterium]
MKFVTRLILVVAIVTAGMQTRFSSGSPGTPTGDGSRWSISIPRNGAVLSSHPGYLGAGTTRGLASLTVYQQTDHVPGVIYPSELTLLHSEYVSTYGSTTWIARDIGASGDLFAVLLPESLGESSGGPSLLVETHHDIMSFEETDVADLVECIGGCSTAFTIGSANP